MLTPGRVVAVALALCAGCEVSSQKIQEWKGTVRGPDKIREALKSSRTPMPVRGEALAAEAELGMEEELTSDLHQLNESDAQSVVHEAVPRLAKLAQGEDPNAPPTRISRSAKDALYLGRVYATKEDQAAIDDALLKWVMVDLATRSNAGTVGAEKIFEAAGPERTGPKLVPLASQAGANRNAACEILGRVGDAASRERAGAELVKVARKESPLREDTIRCLGQLAGPSATAFLMEVVKSSDEERRQDALGALQLHPSPIAVELALSIAKDKKQPGTVRESAFSLLERTGGKQAVSGLLPLLADADSKVALRAVEAALKAGHADAVLPVLDRVTPRLFKQRDDVTDFLVKDLVRLGAPALPPLRQALGSKNPVGRLAAIMALEILGTRDDAEAVGKLISDGTRLGIKGIAGGGTIGAEARAVVEKLKRKG